MTQVRVALAFAATLVGGCVGEATRSRDPGYPLAGGWAFKDPIKTAYPIEPGDCGTDFGIRYGEGGRFVGYEEEGRWSTADGVLTEVVDREIGEDGEMTAVAPKTRRGRLRWLSPRHVNVDFDGDVSGMIRCSD